MVLQPPRHGVEEEEEEECWNEAATERQRGRVEGREGLGV